MSRIFENLGNNGASAKASLRLRHPCVFIRPGEPLVGETMARVSPCRSLATYYGHRECGGSGNRIRFRRGADTMVTRFQTHSAANCGIHRDGLAVCVQRQVNEYFAGSRRTFGLALAPACTPFQKSVGPNYSAFGSAKPSGRRRRRVGRGNATNPIALIVPCHRVIGLDGKPTGYAFGIALKEKLLFRSAATAQARENCLPSKQQ